MSYKVGWFSTGRDAAAQNLLRAVYNKRDCLGIEIPFVFSNWEIGEDPNQRDFPERENFFRLVNKYGIDPVALSWKKFEPKLRKERADEWRVAYGREMRERLRGYEHDLDVLAGYMLWVDNETCTVFEMINLHPALPDGPKGTWQEVIRELIGTRARNQGAMMHLVTGDWDRGPPVSYCSFPITGKGYDNLWEGSASRDETSNLFRKIRMEGERREIPLIIHTIGLFSKGKVRVDSSLPDKRILSGDEVLKSGYDLTDLVDKEIMEV